jgi:hypothetical protein
MKKPVVKVTLSSFRSKTELARYISPIERNGKNHASRTAFMLDEDNPTTNEERLPHLSVNATECEPIKDIANYFREKFQKGSGDVAICVHKVQQYVDRGRKAGASIRSSNSDPFWLFEENGVGLSAFKHRPVSRRGGPNSPSHCGVEFVRKLDDLQQRNFSRLMAKYPRFHALTE